MRTTRNEMTNIGHMMNNLEIARELTAEHDAIAETARPVVAKHLALAFYKEGDNLAEHTRCAMNLRPEYLDAHAHRIPHTEADFDSWDGKAALCDAIILDTMVNVSSEMLGADDSRADYMPDGITQMKVLTDDSYDGNGFLWYCINNLYKTMQDVDGYNDDDAEHVDEHILAVWEATMQDATSGILYDLSVAYHHLHNA